MVCAPCLIPLLGGAALTGGAAVQAQKESEREYRWVYILLIVLGVSLLGYWWWKKRQAAASPGTCSTCRA